MPDDFKTNPILNSPYQPPGLHWELDGYGHPTGVKKDGRRTSIHLVPVPQAKKKKGAEAQRTLELEEKETPNPIVNKLRPIIERWRAEPSRNWRVTYETERLLKHWRSGHTKQRLFFCQIEAAETIIWLTEVAPHTSQGKEILDLIKAGNAEANPDLFRMACKMATGSGKTTVMGMLIAWHAANKARRPNSKTFSDAFLIVTPGITIRDRLRVLQPGDLGNVYSTSGIVPQDMMDDVRKAQIVITNYHAFKLRETMQLSKGAREILKGRQEEFSTTETEGQMLVRVCRELMGKRDIIVINDEAHHCYRHRVIDREEEEKLTAEEKEEADKNSKAARVWISGIEAADRQLRVKAVYDLSATPFFLRGSGYTEGNLFPALPLKAARDHAAFNGSAGNSERPTGGILDHRDRGPDACPCLPGTYGEARHHRHQRRGAPLLPASGHRQGGRGKTHRRREGGG